MSRSTPLGLLFICALLTCPTLVSAGEPAEGERLHQIFHDEWEWELKENPIMATFTGDPRYGDRVPDMSLEAIERRRVHAHEVKSRLETIDRDALSDDDKLNYDLFLLNTQQEIEGQRFRREFMPITQMGGLHSRMATLARMTPKFRAQQVDDLLTRLSQLPTVVDQMIVLMKKGLEMGLTPPRITLREVAGQMEAQITANPTESPVLVAAVGDLPSSIPPEEQERLRARAETVVAEAVVPSLRKLHRFWVEEYYPRTREEIGVSALPDGAAWYDYNVKVRTTTDLTAEEIHQIGVREVARIRAEMEKVKEEAGFEGSLVEFFEFLRTDPQFFFTEPEDLLAAYRDIAKRVDPELVKLFGKLPRLPYGVTPVPKETEKTQTTAYYQPGSLEAGRPGYFYANTYDLKSRPKWEMEALTVHEAVPGHHFQIALAQELEDVPRFRRFGGYTAFVEGWGLYSESLGPDLGLYEDPYSRFGQLTYEMWRAIRLVVDTGMHAKGWTRQQAIDFFLENAGKAEHDIVVEVDRYIVWPGQALAYKIGELKIKELRRHAEETLGDSFDVRAFHDTLLGAGAIPLSTLEERMKAWVAAQGAETTTSES
jgi:uncharacterized protein (DUF885 family)